MRLTETLGDAVARVRPLPRRPPARRRGDASEALKTGTKGADPTQLEERRRELVRSFVALQWDLGGLAYEMASRDHYRLDVLTRLAARLQQVDGELGQTERMLALQTQGAAGVCPSCGGMQARGAVFCWQCGKELTLPAPASSPVESLAAKAAAASQSAPPSGAPGR